MQRGDPRIVAASPLISRTLYSPQLKTSLLVSGVDFFSQLEFRDASLDSSIRETRGQNAPVPGRNSEGAIRFLLDPKAIAVSERVGGQKQLESRLALDTQHRAKARRV